MNATQTGRECIKDHRAQSAQIKCRLSCSGLVHCSRAQKRQMPFHQNMVHVLHSDLAIIKHLLPYSLKHKTEAFVMGALAKAIQGCQTS